MKPLALLRHRNVQITLGTSLAILILVVTLSPGVSNKHSRSSPNSTSSPGNTQISDKQLHILSTYRQSISTKLPLYIPTFHTSVDLDTSIHIFIWEKDPPEVVRFEIAGISYQNPDDNPLTNPNVQAFRESYQEGLKIIKNAGIDAGQLMFVYGFRPYIRTRAESWVDKFHLKP